MKAGLFQTQKAGKTLFSPDHPHLENAAVGCSALLLPHHIPCHVIHQLPDPLSARPPFHCRSSQDRVATAPQRWTLRDPIPPQRVLTIPQYAAAFSASQVRAGRDAKDPGDVPAAPARSSEAEPMEVDSTIPLPIPRYAYRPTGPAPAPAAAPSSERKQKIHPGEYDLR